MATVTTPNGERLEGVTGSLLDYYRGEANTVPGYVIDDSDVVVADTPRLVEGDVVTPLNVDPEDEPVQEPVDSPDDDSATSADAPAEQPSDAPDGQPVVDDVAVADDSPQLDKGKTKS